jgi:hypothetical protein
MKLSTRQMGQLYQPDLSGNDRTREVVVTQPLLVLPRGRSRRTRPLSRTARLSSRTCTRWGPWPGGRTAACGEGDACCRDGSRASGPCPAPGPGRLRGPSGAMGEAGCSITPHGRQLMEERCRRRPTSTTTSLDYPEWQTSATSATRPHRRPLPPRATGVIPARAQSTTTTLLLVGATPPIRATTTLSPHQSAQTANTPTRTAPLRDLSLGHFSVAEPVLFWRAFKRAVSRPPRASHHACTCLRAAGVP